VKAFIAILSAALLAAFLSGTVYMRLGGPVRYEGVEPGWSYMKVMVRGWPLPFLYDKVGLSPGDRVDWVGALLGLDEFRPLPFGGDVAIYAIAFAAVWWAGRRFRLPGS
jgi:hypothetical protein